MPEQNSTLRRCRAGEIAIPIFLMSAGFLLLMSNLGEIHAIHLRDVWPLLLIAAGIENLVPRKWKRQ